MQNRKSPYTNCICIIYMLPYKYIYFIMNAVMNQLREQLKVCVQIFAFINAKICTQTLRPSEIVTSNSFE